MPPTPPSAQEENSAAPQQESDTAQEEFDEVNNARQRPDEAPGGRAAFTGLGGTARWGKMRAILSTEQAATSPPPSGPPKTFTPNPTPLKTSVAELPNPPSSPQQTPTSPDSPREFHLTIQRSLLNHQTYIERQHYYGGFQLDLKSLMGDDLRVRVPVAGMADCQLGKLEVPLRVRMKRRQEEAKTDWVSLGRLWEEGERQRDNQEKKESWQEKQNKIMRNKMREREMERGSEVGSEGEKEGGKEELKEAETGTEMLSFTKQESMRIRKV